MGNLYGVPAPVNPDFKLVYSPPPAFLARRLPER